MTHLNIGVGLGCGLPRRSLAIHQILLPVLHATGRLDALSTWISDRAVDHDPRSFGMRAAFDAFELTTVSFPCDRLRHAAVNGPDYQTSDWPLFLEAAYSVTGGLHTLHALLRDTISNKLTPMIIPYIATKRGTHRSGLRLIGEALAELNRRLRGIALEDKEGTCRDEIDAVARIDCIGTCEQLAVESRARSIEEWAQRAAISRTRYCWKLTCARVAAGRRQHDHVTIRRYCVGPLPEVEPRRACSAMS